MISFRKYIIENNLYIPKKAETAGVTRENMPQIDKEHMNDFFKYLNKNDVSYEKKQVDPSSLKAIQSNFNKDKIKSMIDDIDKIKDLPILVSSDGYVLDGNHRWLAHVNSKTLINIYKLDATSEQAYQLMHAFEKSYTKTLKEQANTCALISFAHLKQFETLVDRMFKKFGIDFKFTKHFGERLSDKRNDPCVTLEELADFVKKIYAKHGNPLKDKVGSELVLRDLQKDLNIPVSVEYDRTNDEIDVVMKTIMRKKNFTSPDKIINYK